jgi:hypothetical protein
MIDRYSEHVQGLREAIFGAGVTDPALRRAVASRAAAAGGGSAAALPSELIPFVDKVARHAYQVTREDIDALRAGGHSEDAIFEVTVSAAVGAALSRLDRGMAALRGEEL